MARVTVEDCIKQVPNRFEVVVLAAQRTRDISSGVPLTLPQDNDKNPVIALREIAAGNLNIDALRNAQINNLQKNNRIDEDIDKNIYTETQDLNLDTDFSNSIEDNGFSLDEENDLDLEMDFSDNVIDDDFKD